MGFRVRVALFVALTLVVVFGMTALFAYRATRQALVEQGRHSLDAAGAAFSRQLDDVSDRVAESVQVLALDYALRAAIAQRDEATLRSALANHGRRVGATQMLALDTAGRVEADTNGVYPVGAAFPYDDLVARAPERPSSAVVAARGQAHWLVVVPVFAPDIVGYIAASIPLDDALLARLHRQSTLATHVELAVRRQADWRVLARAGEGRDISQRLDARRVLPSRSALVQADGRDYVALAVPMAGTRSTQPVSALLSYSVDDALRSYRPIGVIWAALGLLGLIAGLAGAWLIARGVSRPVEQLALAARRLAAGDYRDPPAIERRDEIGALAGACASMASSVREREARLVHQAAHDLTTGLPNRFAMEARMQEAFAGGTRQAAVLVVGLARLPEIIKTMGHEVGDRVMRDVGARVGACAGDCALARATEAQFAIFLPGAGRDAAVALAFRIVEVLGEPYRETEFSLDLTPAVAVALAPAHGTDAGTLLRHADAALWGAFGSHDPVAIYDPATDPHRPERLSLMGDLREAIERNQLEMHYQPKLHLASGRIDSAEALVRWTHPARGAIPPDAFIGLAEETGNIRRLTRWALAAGIVQASLWPQVRIAVNISARDLDDARLPRRVAQLLSAHAVAPSRLVLELTESAIISRPETAFGVLDAIAAQGVDIAIDDFGVGQSSLSYLRRLPVTELKIDRTFVAKLAQAHDDRIIVQSIIDLGHRLGYAVTAEGVEDAEALAFLAQAGCDHAQGFLVAAALPVAGFNQRLAGQGARGTPTQ
jgi:diguanylate cyclase (GGDEF)-like protein